MKFNLVLLTSILQLQAKETGIHLECYTKVDCKVLDFMKEAMESEKGAECMSKDVISDHQKCQLKIFGLSEDQAELALKVLPYNLQCMIKPETEFETCAVGCTKQKDRDGCLENCALSSKVKTEECLNKLAGKSTGDASKNAKCIMKCDKNSYAEIFNCIYNCHKDVIDTLVDKGSTNEDDIKELDKSDDHSNHKSTEGVNKSSSSGSQAKPTGSSQPQPGSSGQSSAYLTSQASSLAKITLSILIASLFI
jgi:hypothetical protein